MHALVKKVFEKRQTLNFLISRMLFIVMGHLVDPGLQDFQLNVHFSTAKTSNKIEILQNFERPFTPRGWLRSASNFGKTRFRWFPTFHFATTKQLQMLKFVRKLWTVVYPPRMAPIGEKLGQNAFQVIPDISFFDVENRKNSVVLVYGPGQDTRD